MRAIFKDDVIVFVPETGAEREDVRRYADARVGNVFELRGASAAMTLRDLGRKAEACREPTNIGSRIATVAWRAISNFAHTPFELDGRKYARIEGFWQSTGTRPLEHRMRNDSRSIPGVVMSQSWMDVRAALR